MNATRKINPVLKGVLEGGPLLLFFIANYKFDLFTATGVLMAAAVTALIASWVLTRQVPIMPVVTTVLVLVFGALTLYFHDQTFIKMKPTIANSLFGLGLLVSLYLGRPLLPLVLGHVLSIDAAGWRILTLRWALFFFVLAILNEIVWRTQSDQFWAAFKVFGTAPLTLLFTLLQAPLVMRHELKPQDAAQADERM